VPPFYSPPGPLSGRLPRSLSLDVEGGGGPFRPGGSGTSTSVGQTWHGRDLPSLQLWRLLPSLQLRRVFEPRSALSPSDGRVQPPL
jgi:hypothetical protein